MKHLKLFENKKQKLYWKIKVADLEIALKIIKCDDSEWCNGVINFASKPDSDLRKYEYIFVGYDPSDNHWGLGL